MKLFNHEPFDPLASHILSAEFLKVCKKNFTKKQMSAFANKLFILTHKNVLYLITLTSNFVSDIYKSE